MPAHSHNRSDLSLAALAAADLEPVATTDDDLDLDDLLIADEEVVLRADELDVVVHRTAILAPEVVAWDDDADAPTHSSYLESIHGPEPVPAWLVTDDEAMDEELGILKTGKEADVHLIRRSVGSIDGRPAKANVLAAKRYRDDDHRTFRRDVGYRDGQKHRDSRSGRAKDSRTRKGRAMLANEWAEAEFALLARMWEAGVAVPYPVQLIGGELLLELIGDADQQAAAPRLAAHHPADKDELASLWAQAVEILRALARAGLAHADLSPYNLLVSRLPDGTCRLVAIDVPQAVDLALNPHGLDLLRRDCTNVCDWFLRKGLPVDADALFAELLVDAFGGP